MDIFGNILGEFREDSHKEEEGKDVHLFRFFQDYINVLEGIKTQVKNIHWSSPKLPNRDKRGAHLYLDDLLEDIDSFQDVVAEAAMGATGVVFDFNSVYGTSFSVSSTGDLLKYIQSKTCEFYDRIPNDSHYVGIRSETETFILKLGQYVYRFKLTE